MGKPSCGCGGTKVCNHHERRYHAAMADWMADRGFHNLAQSHQVALRDCPEGCRCSGCKITQRDREDAEETKRARRAKRQAASVA